MLCAGPGLNEAEKEVVELAGVYPDALALTGPEPTWSRFCAPSTAPGSVTSPPTAGSVRQRAVLLAADARRRADRLYDLESLDRPPALLVLAACDVGMSQIQAGDELMGVAAEVLSMGTMQWRRRRSCRCPTIGSAPT